MVQIENLPLILTGLSITVSIVYYTSVLRNAKKTQQIQLETRQAQLFMQFVNPFLSGEKSTYWHEIREWEMSDYDDFIRVWSDPENRKSFSQMSYWFETLGVYVREGLIPIRLVALTMTGMVTDFWIKLSLFAA